MASSNFTVKVEGLPEFQALVMGSMTEIETELALGMKNIANVVAARVRAKYSPYSAPGAAGVKAKLSGGQVWTGKAVVAQTLAKSRTMSMRRTNFGPLMMKKAFLPALDATQEYARMEAEALLARLETRWELEGI
jgi:hypothetical protein